MQHKIGLYFNTDAFPEIFELLRGNQITLYSVEDYYTTFNKNDISILTIKGNDCFELIINFLSECSEAYLVIISDNPKVIQDPFVEHLDNIYLLHHDDFEEELPRIIQDIQKNLNINEHYFKFLYNLLNIEGLDKKAKRRIFDLCEGFKKNTMDRVKGAS
jgi:hypothetical protein